MSPPAGETGTRFVELHPLRPARLRSRGGVAPSTKPFYASWRLHGHGSGAGSGPGSIEQIFTLPASLPVSRDVPSRKAGACSGSPPVEASEQW